jgi:hypothetical protein
VTDLLLYVCLCPPPPLPLSGRPTIAKFAAWVKSALFMAMQLLYVVHDDVLLHETPFSAQFDTLAHCFTLKDVHDNSTRLPLTLPKDLFNCTNLHQRATRAHEVRRHL